MRKTLHSILEPLRTGFLQVSSLHNLYWEVSGNNEGKPVIILHGGPGGGSQAKYRGFFDPTVYKIVQMDQRGAGKSTPWCCLEENTTWDLVEDIEKLRKELKIEKWHTVFGGSWGSTLSLAYAETHPDKVEHLILRGIFLCRREEIQFFYQDGSSWIFPEYYEEFKNLLPEGERDDILFNYWRRITGKNEEERVKYAKAWTKWEMATSRLFVDQEMVNKGEDEKFAVAFASIETHYFVNAAFLKKNQLLEDAWKIKDIPTTIVQGRYDMVCPAKSAYDLQKKLNKSKLVMIPDAGHNCFEPGILDGLVTATEDYKNN